MMMGFEELAYNMEIAFHIYDNLTKDVIDAIDYACDGHDNREMASFLAEKVAEFRGNEDFDGQYGSTSNDVYWFVVYNRDKWIEELYAEGARNYG